MFSPRTLAIFVALALAYALLALPALFWDDYLSSPVGVLVALPYLSGALLHQLGVPGVLAQGGACGWGWCPLSELGWILVVGLWLTLAWFVAWAIGRRPGA